MNHPLHNECTDFFNVKTSGNTALPVRQIRPSEQTPHLSHLIGHAPEPARPHTVAVKKGRLKRPFHLFVGIVPTV